VSEKTRVAVIGGGANGEHEVSLASARAAASALDPTRYEPVRLTIAQDGSWRIGDEPARLSEAVAALGDCHVALPLVHGAPGEDGTIAALCELAGIPYVGSGVSAGALAMDKHATKLLAASIGLRTAAGALLTRATRDAYAWAGPVVVKPADGGSSRGVTPVREPAALVPALDEAFRWGDRVLVEELITGREIDIAVLETREGVVLGPPLEIRARGFFDYEAKYGAAHESEVAFEIPAAITAQQQRRLEQGAIALYRGLGCRGVARLDFFLDERGWVLNEVNTTPGFSPASQVPQMFAAIGVPYPRLLDLLIREALP